MDICVQVFVWTCNFISLGYIPRVELLGHIVTLWLTFWGSARLSHNNCIFLHCPSAVNEDPNFTTPSSTFVFFIISILIMIVKWYIIMVLICISLTGKDVEHLFIMVLICISLTGKDVEHLFLYLVTICISPLEKGLFSWTTFKTCWSLKFLIQAD